MNTQKLGFLTVLCLIIGNMFGPGILILPSVLSKYGSLSLMGWGISFLGAISLGAIFIRLSSRLNQSGGPYTYCKQAFGDFIGFQMVWIYWIGMWVGSTATITMTLGYIKELIRTINPELMNSSLSIFLLGILFIWFITGLNAFGLKWRRYLQVSLTILPIILLLILLVFGLPEINWVNFTVFNPSGESTFQSLISVITLTLWAFLGLESGTIPSNHIQNPKKTISRATFWAIFIVAVLYIFSSALCIGLIPNDILQATSAPFTLAFEKIFGFHGTWIMTSGIVIISLSTLNGWFYLHSYIPLWAAKDGIFPIQFSQTNSNGIPVFGLLITAILMSCLLATHFNETLIKTFHFMINLATLSFLIVYLFSIFSEFLLILKSPIPISKKELVKLFCLMTASFIFVVIAIVGAGKSTIAWGSFLFFGSIPIYLFVKWQQTSLLQSKNSIEKG